MSQVNTKFIANSAVTNAKLANMAAGTVKANITGGSAAPTDVSVLPSSVIGLTRTINAQTGTTYTFALSDGSAAGGNPLVTASNSSAQTYTVPTNASVAFPVGTQIDLIQLGAGIVTIAAAGGVTIVSQDTSLALASQYASATIVKTATNTWTLITGNSSGTGGSVLPSSVIGLTRTINAQTGTTYTFALADGSAAGGNPLVTASNSSAQTYTVPTNASVAFPVGTQIDLIQLGTGQVTIAAAGGVTIVSQDTSLALASQYASATIVKTATNTWTLITGNSSGTGGGSVLTIATKTSNYALTTSDQLIIADGSGGAFTLTLPTAVGVTGQVYYLRRKDNTIANAVTLNTTSSQTIEGYASGVLNLSTQFEEITLTSDGSNWIVIGHRSTTTRISYSATTSGFGTPANATYYWWRNGKNIRVNAFFTTGTVSASLASISLPSGLNIDSTVIQAETTSNAGPCVGRSYQAVHANQVTDIIVSTTTSTSQVYFGGEENGSTIGIPQNGSTIYNNGSVTIADFEVPISGWLE